MRKILALFIGIWLCQLDVTQAVAQNVTISPTTGKLVAGLTYDGELGFQNGWSSLWRHEQLPLTLTVSDKADISGSGVLTDPAGDIVLDASQGKYVVVSGQPLTTELHMCISLPKGYRFTGYRMVFLNNVNGKTVSDLELAEIDKQLYETGSDFDFNQSKATTGNMPGTNDTKEYVIERTSKNQSDMGNNLYFLLHHNVSGFYGVTLKSCELYFTAEGAFDAKAAPSSPADIVSQGVNMIGSPFNTGKLDLGEIKPHTKNGKTFYSYDYQNVEELKASNWLYQEDAVTADKKLPTTAGTGSIQALQNGGQLYYALGNNTYYIESPTATVTQNGIAVPLGYRITGAKIKYHYGKAAAAGNIRYNGNKVRNPAFKPSPYTLKVYSTNKDEIKETRTVKSGPDGTVELTGLNNDAIKFSIEGLAPDTKALLTFELTLEALNPFINNIDIICHSLAASGPTLMQQFTSNDFQVSGGKFVFYVPQDFFGGGEQRCRFTFENLYSKYGDETYQQTDPRHARYFFVKSKYYNDTDGQQYSTTGYEPASDKIATSMCGNKAFKYSNIDELSNTNISGSATQLQEYPYSENLYLSQEGSFSEDIVIKVGEGKPCYLFTADETRWNVAPTTAMEHRYYAYYLMDLKLETKDYVAKCVLTKIYDKTCYNRDGKDTELPMYGGEFKALDAITGDEIPAGRAYLTVPMMKQALKDELYGNPEKHIAGVGATDMQVLYLDYTNLYSVHIPEASAMNAMKAQLNPNCLIYFPERTCYQMDNYVQKTKSGDYRACKNIVITDRQPFYAPYKITVPAENYASYTREITIPANGKVAYATVVLPFTLEVTDGVHTNEDGLCSFKVSKMTPDNCLALEDGEYASALSYRGKAKFDLITGTHTEANVPYMVEVTTAPTDENISFIAKQKGSDIMATKGSAMDANEYTFSGETSTGKIGATTYNFHNYGSYAGKKIDRAAKKVFYFAKNMYLSSTNLRPEFPYVYVYPFRAFYEYSSAGAPAKMFAFRTVFGDDDNMPTSITDINTEPDLAIIPGQGTITAMAREATVVKVYSTSGVVVWSVSLQRGETQTVTLPGGFYVVNGKKIIVK